MKVHPFDYTDQKYVMKLLGSCLLVFLIFQVVLAKSIKVVGFPGMIATFAIPVAIFLFGKRKIKLQGSVAIDETAVEFQLPDRTFSISYAEVRRYKIEHYSGGFLKLWLSDGSVLSLQSNTNFVNSIAFEQVCTDLERKLERYTKTNNVIMERVPSIFERVWMLPFLIGLSALLVASIAYAHYFGKRIPPSLYGGFAAVVSLWIGYATAGKRKQQ